MTRPVCLFTGQWADLPLATLALKAHSFGYDGLELACWGDHFDVHRALADKAYCKRHWQVLADHGIHSFAISNHLVGQAVCDLIDERHKAILPERVWGDGDPEGVRRRAAREMIDTAKAARAFFDAAPTVVKERLSLTQKTVVVGFTGSSIWNQAYAFPPPLPGAIERGFTDFAARWTPIFDEFQKVGVVFALEVHPTEIAFDIVSTERALAAVKQHPCFGFNFDPSHFGYQGVDYLEFLRRFGARVHNVHVKDVWWSASPTPVGTFGGHTDFGSSGRNWDFRSPGRGRIDFEGIVRVLNQIDYRGPLTVEWEDAAMDREHGAEEAASFVRRLDFPRSNRAFDAAFSRDESQ
ncbi:MAG: sugar phosphate isomerase/epimerase [Planctomycetota bacterium]|nr:sugar phosphate isomerase/epimerase [Planctomycetota bacterium]